MKTILIEKNFMVPMRDGVRLATDIYRLEKADPTPVLVVRTPYNKDSLVAGGDVFNILRAVQAGYTIIAQDVRGRYASEGTFNPHVQETAVQYQPAINRIFHDTEHPSRLILPLIEK